MNFRDGRFSPPFDITSEISFLSFYFRYKTTRATDYMPNKKSGITRQSEEEADRLLGKTVQQRFLKVKTNQQNKAEKKGNMTTYFTVK